MAVKISKFVKIHKTQDTSGKYNLCLATIPSIFATAYSQMMLYSECRKLHTMLSFFMLRWWHHTNIINIFANVM